MNKQLPLVSTNLDRIFKSPLSFFVDEFFTKDLPLTLIDRKDNFPKYDIYYAPCDEEDDDKNAVVYDRSEFIIDLALAGYSKESLDVYTKNDTLYVEDISEIPEKQPHYMYHGITSKSFKWSLKLPKYAKIKSVRFINGLLRITVKINEPEQTDNRVPYKIAD